MVRNFLALAFACLLLAACGPYTLTPAEQDKVELGALKYATASGSTFVGCSGQDSDGDNYVTCTIAKNNVEREVLCSFTASGCKAKQ